MICPLLSALRKQDCIESKCKFWTHLMGKNPQGEGVLDKFGCAIEFLPILLVENAQMMRQGAASTDKVANIVNGLRGEVATSNQILFEARRAQSQRLLDAENGKQNLK